MFARSPTRCLLLFSAMVLTIAQPVASIEGGASGPISTSTPRRWTSRSDRGGCCFSIRFRSATESDTSHARRIILSQFMNPLGVSRETLLVAYDGDGGAGEDDNMLGFGQIRPLGVVSRPGGSSRSPPTKHRYHELASLYVPPPHRNRGVGSAIVAELLRRFDAEERGGGGGGDDEEDAVVCLLTLLPTVPFYRTFGFRSLDVGGGDDDEEIPPPLRFEYAAGTALSSVLGNDLVCMVRD